MARESIGVNLQWPRENYLVRSEILTEGRPEEIKAARLLSATFQWIDGLVVRSSNFAVNPGSVLARDDELTNYDPLSYQANFLLMFGFDYVDLLRRTITDHGMPTVGVFPLVRSAVEAASEVSWLTSGGTRGKRIFRTLHRVWNSANKGEPTLARIIPGRESNTDAIKARLVELLGAVKGQQKSLDSKYPSTTAIVKEASKNWPSGRTTPLAAWGLCSAMSHANSDIARAVLEKHEVGPRDALGSTFRMTTSYQLATVFMSVVERGLERALDSRDTLNDRPDR